MARARHPGSYARNWKRFLLKRLENTSDPVRFFFCVWMDHLFSSFFSCWINTLRIFESYCPLITLMFCSVLSFFFCARVALLSLPAFHAHPTGRLSALYETSRWGVRESRYDDGNKPIKRRKKKGNLFH